MRIIATLIPLLIIGGLYLGYKSYRSSHGHTIRYYEEIKWWYEGFSYADRNYVKEQVVWGDGSSEDVKRLLKHKDRFATSSNELSQFPVPEELRDLHTRTLKSMKELSELYNQWIEQVKKGPASPALIQEFHQKAAELKQSVIGELEPRALAEFQGIQAPLYTPGYPNRFIPEAFPWKDYFKDGLVFNSIVAGLGGILILACTIYAWKRRGWLAVLLAWLSFMPFGAGVVGYWLGYIKALAVMQHKSDAITWLDIEVDYQRARFTLELGLQVGLAFAAFILLMSLILPPKPKPPITP